MGGKPSRSSRLRTVARHLNASLICLPVLQKLEFLITFSRQAQSMNGMVSKTLPEPVHEQVGLMGHCHLLCAHRLFALCPFDASASPKYPFILLPGRPCFSWAIYVHWPSTTSSRKPSLILPARIGFYQGIPCHPIKTFSGCIY